MQWVIKTSKLTFIEMKNYVDGRMFDPRITQGGGDYKFFGFQNNPHKRRVKVRRIDDFKFSKVDVVLIDTQGFDHFVLRGMKETIQRHLPKILTEFTPQWIRDLGDDPVQVLKEYKSWGYKVHSVDMPELNSLNESSFIQGIEKSNTFFTNLSLEPN